MYEPLCRLFFSGFFGFSPPAHAYPAVAHLYTLYFYVFYFRTASTLKSVRDRLLRFGVFRHSQMSPAYRMSLRLIPLCLTFANWALRDHSTKRWIFCSLPATNFFLSLSKTHFFERRGALRLFSMPGSCRDARLIFHRKFCFLTKRLLFASFAARSFFRAF